MSCHYANKRRAKVARKTSIQKKARLYDEQLHSVSLSGLTTEGSFSIRLLRPESLADRLIGRDSSHCHRIVFPENKPCRNGTSLTAVCASPLARSTVAAAQQGPPDTLRSVTAPDAGKLQDRSRQVWQSRSGCTLGPHDARLRPDEHEVLAPNATDRKTRSTA